MRIINWCFLLSIFFCSCGVKAYKAKQEAYKNWKDSTLVEFDSGLNNFSKYTQYINVSDGDTVCDIGGGWGFHSAMMAKYMPQNITYFEEDIDKKYCNKRFFKSAFDFLNPSASINNYRFYIGSDTKIPLEDNAFKTVTLFISIHEFVYRDAMMNEIKRIMKTNGKLYVLENAWKATPVRDTTCKLTYLSEKELYGLLAKNGFGFTRHILPKEDTAANCIAHFLECYKLDQ